MSKNARNRQWQKERSQPRQAEKRKRQGDAPNKMLKFESLEKRQVLASLFPAYINGVLTLGDASSPAPYRLEDTLFLESNPNSTKTILLDVTGHRSVNNGWGHDETFNPFDLDGNPGSFSDAELIEIQRTWQQVAEDFSGFDVNVTTRDRGVDRLIRSSPSDDEYGMRCLMTQQTAGFNGPWGGIAFLNSFGSDDDTPCFAINKGWSVGGMTVSHEIGHTLGLRHDGLNGSAYHPGVGSGAISWGPIMGAPFGAQNVQWSRGGYTGADNLENDYDIINGSGVPFRVDDYGNTIGTASDLELTNDTTVFDWGFVSTPTDIDVLKFEAGDGEINITVNPFGENPNLDVFLELLDENGVVIASSNPAGQLSASINVSVTQGFYFLRIDGVGHANNENNDYGSTGFYTVSGTIVEPIRGPQVIGETQTISVNSSWQTVNFSKRYQNPIVVAGPASQTGLDPVTIRIRNITRDSFQIKVDEWDYQDKIHGAESVSYMVFEAGTYNLPDGTRIEAGKTVSTHRWVNVGFQTDSANGDSGFQSNPVVFAQIGTTREISAATTRIANVSKSGFRVRVQEEQASDFVHKAEAVHYVAFSRGMGSLGDVTFEVGATGNVVTHQPHTIEYQSDLTATPSLFAAMQSYNGGDPATVRMINNNRLRTRVFLEEERSFDEETAHNPETVGYLAIKSGILLYQAPDNIPPQFMQSGLGVNDPVRVQRAWEILQSYEHDTLPCSCTCPSCLGDMLVAEDGINPTEVATFVFRIEEESLSQFSESPVDQPVELTSSLPLAELKGAVELADKKDDAFWNEGEFSDLNAETSELITVDTTP